MSTPEQDRRVARIKWCLSEAAVNIGAAMTTGTLNKLAEAIATVMEDQGIWLLHHAGAMDLAPMLFAEPKGPVG